MPDVPVHIVQRGHSREPVFFEAQDYATYAHWVKEAAAKYAVAVHAFVLIKSKGSKPFKSKGSKPFKQL